MSRMVVLQHTLADGSIHYDWLIDRPAPPGTPPVIADAPGDPQQACLISFRVIEHIHTPDVRHFSADRLPDHRRLYLTYQGDITGGRGTVRHIAGGLVRHVEEMDDGKAISIRGKFFDCPEYIWAGVKEGDLWSFRRSQAIVLDRPKPAGPDHSWGLMDMPGYTPPGLWI